MNIGNKKDYTVAGLTQLREFEMQLDNFERINTHLIRNIADQNNGDFILKHFVDVEEGSLFYFIVKYQIREAHKNYYTVSFKPQSMNSTAAINQRMEAEAAISYFNNWIGILEAYQKIPANSDEFYEMHYEKEIYESITLVDTDANEVPFPLSKQIILLGAIEKIENEANKLPPSPATEKLLRETQELKENMNSSTKNVTTRKFAKILALSQKINTWFFRTVLDVVVKEVIKAGLYGNLTQIQNLINN